MDTVAVMQQGFRIGSVLKNTFSICKKGFLPLTALALLFLWPVNLFNYHLMADYLNLQPGELSNDPALAIEMMRVSFLSSAIDVVASNLVVAFLTLACSSLLLDEKVTLWESITVGFSRLIPIVILAFVTSIAYLLGLFFLVIPFFFFVVLFWVDAPAVILEKRGAFSAIRRSMELTKGCRWQILGLLVIVVGISVVLGLLNAGLQELLADDLLMAMRVAAPVNAILTVFVTALTVSSYHALVVSKEGASRQQAAAVFS